MKYFPLVWAGIWRKRSRAILLLSQIALAFTLYGVLHGLTSGVTQAIARAHGDRLFVVNRLSSNERLPIAYYQQLQRMPGVLAASVRVQFGGISGGPGRPVVGLATYPAEFFAMYPEIHVPSAQIRALEQTPSGMIVGERLARQRGWKIGDRIPIQGTIPKKDGTYDWSFDIVGIYSHSELPQSARLLIMNYDYVNASRVVNRDTADVFTVRVTSAAVATRVGLRIDDRFSNSSNETRSLSENEMVQAQLHRIGDIDFLARAVAGAAFFGLLCATAALMLQSIRERVSELAIYKTVGYPDALVMRIIMAESALVCLLGAAIGLGVAAALLPLAENLIGITTLPLRVLFTGLTLALVLGALSGGIPAWRGLKLKVVDALSDAQGAV